MNNDTNQFYNQNDYNNELSSLNYNDGKKNNSGTKIFIMSIVFLLLVIAGGVIFMAMKDKKGWFASSDADSQVYLKNVNLSIGDGVITYIPLDDRPVNVERVQYLADIAGYKLAMPNKAYYPTILPCGISRIFRTLLVTFPAQLFSFLRELSKPNFHPYPRKSLFSSIN